MAIGLAGDSSGATDGYATGQLVLVELRVQSTFLQAIAAGQVPDQIQQLRNDEAFQLGITQPVP